MTGRRGAARTKSGGGGGASEGGLLRGEGVLLFLNQASHLVLGSGGFLPRLP